MNLSLRFRRTAAAVLAACTVGVGAVALTAEPAAAWPSTIKICNDGHSNGNIDVTRAASGGYPSYSNELEPDECTGSTLAYNSTHVSLIRLDLTDDSANDSWLKSVEQGAIGDGFDDSQGPWDPDCATASSSSDSVALNSTLADHVTSEGYRVRIYNKTLCGGNEPDWVRICNSGSSIGNFDVYKNPPSNYSNELAPAECTNWNDASSVSPVLMDLGDDGARTSVEFTEKRNSDALEVQGCTRVDSTNGNITAVDPTWLEAGSSGTTVKLFTSGGTSTMCGAAITDPNGTAAPQTSLPACPSPATQDQEECNPFGADTETY